VIRRASAAAILLISIAAAARAQLVPITRCQAAIPCSIPYGLRPADAAAWTPGARVGQGNTAISIGVDDRLKPEVQTPHVSEDPTERAARIFMRRNPLPTPRPTPKPAAVAKPG